ncbi:MAG: DDE-type integrase/transposase/recombinase [Nitrospira sp. BO4]|nr:DDE-type integrase/transposase/recombinase [Nitrospira sp. BO4]
MVCRVLGKPRSWWYDRRRTGRARPRRRPELEEMIRQLVGANPPSYGYRRIHAVLKRRGMACNPKTVWRVLRRRGWLSASRRRIIQSGRRHEGRVHVSEPNRRWASDMTSIRAWDGQKGRFAVMIDCADRMVLAWRFARRITATNLTEMLREALWRRFGDARIHARGIELLSDNGPEYTSSRYPTVPWPCSRQPNTMRNGWSQPRTDLSKIRWGRPLPSVMAPSNHSFTSMGHYLASTFMIRP